MSVMLKFKRDEAWMESSLPLSARTVIILQGDDPDSQVPVSAVPLLATSPLIRNILSSGHLAPAYSTPVISCPSVSLDVLQFVGEILVTGKASMEEATMNKVREFFKMLMIEDALVVREEQVENAFNYMVDIADVGLIKIESTDYKDNVNNLVKSDEGEYFEIDDTKQEIDVESEKSDFLEMDENMNNIQRKSKCPKCCKSYFTACSVRRHLSQVHKVTKKDLPMFQIQQTRKPCLFCNKIFGNVYKHRKVCKYKKEVLKGVKRNYKGQTDIKRLDRVARKKQTVAKVSMKASSKFVKMRFLKKSSASSRKDVEKVFEAMAEIMVSSQKAVTSKAGDKSRKNNLKAKVRVNVKKKRKADSDLSEQEVCGDEEDSNLQPSKRGRKSKGRDESPPPPPAKEEYPEPAMPTVLQVCDQWGLNDVDLEYSDADYTSLTTYKLFQQTFRPRIEAENPKVPLSKLILLVAAKWREFTSLGRSEEGSEQGIGGFLTKEVRKSQTREVGRGSKRK